MTRNFRHWLAIALAMLILCSCASAQVQLDRSGSISVRIHTADGANVHNARVEIYRAGDAVIIDNNLRFEPGSGFAGCGLSLENPGDSTLAAKLEDYAVQAQLTPNMQSATDTQGMVRFADLRPGLYLVRQNGFSDGSAAFSEIASFVVTLPMTQDNGWNYEITAQPKVNLLPTSTPSPTTKPIAAPADPTLPQTGMLRWPVPVLGTGGLVLFALGWVLAFTGKKDRNA